MSNTTVQNNSSDTFNNSDWDLNTFLNDNSFEDFGNPDPIGDSADDGSDLAVQTLTGGDSPQSAFGNQTSQDLFAQIKALETRGANLKSTSNQDPELLKVLGDLDTAEMKLQEASRNEKFQDTNHQNQAVQLREIAVQLFGSANSFIENKEQEQTSSANENTAATSSLSEEDQKKLSETLSQKLKNAKSKVGYVHLTYHEDTNWGATGMELILGLGMITDPINDYSVKSDAPTSAYTVGYYNIDKSETASKQPATESGKSHISGDDIASESTYDHMNTQAKAESKDVKDVLRLMGSALKEEDPDKKKEDWNQVVDSLEKWNTKNQDKATVYNRARLLFNAMIGEGGDSDLSKAMQAGIIPQEFCNKISEMLESQPQEVKDQEGNGKDNFYFRGGATDRKWSSSQCVSFIKGMGFSDIGSSEDQDFQDSPSSDPSSTSKDKPEKDSGTAAS